MSTRLSPDGRAVVEAVDRLTTQVKRLADVQSTPVVVGEMETVGTCDASTHGLGAATLGPCILRYQHDGPVHQDETGVRWSTAVAAADDAPTTTAVCNEPGPWGDAHACVRPAGHDGDHEGHDGCGWRDSVPDGDEGALRTARRDSLLVLLSRAGRMRLSTDEAALLRQHVETELRDRDQQYDRAERAVRRAADEYDRRQDAERERDAEQARLRDLLRSESQRANKAIDREATAEQAAEEARAELEQAQAAINRVRALRDPIAEAIEQADYSGNMRRGDLADSVMPVILAALDGTEQPTGCPCHTRDERCSGCGRCPDVCHGCDGPTDTEQP
ncbi:hypothetical protein SEA_ONIONKNIGHT_53 [Streptomyces phage OnionKnight]|nr:hypothetical protein SEA_ONIONKNIGHT_53 [Streptomyces phage OnionKnight]